MANLVELFDNIVQMQNLNGVPLAAGKLYVYALGRTRLMDTWSDVDGESLNPNPIILDDAGQAHVYVSDDFDYTLVVCDQYNNEIFSLDKYLYSKGSHSHADVAVAPSESIAVSSYHVGECTVYVPYLTGQLGKVYEGIDPIVVNNQVDKISANHVPLGVQDPLYFVQDDEEGCIIGLSSVPVPEGTMNESAFGYQDGQITSYNGSAFSAGLNYEAGSYVDIDGNTINVTGLQPAGNYQSAGDYVVHDELSSYATQDWVENQSYMKEYMESAFYPSTSNPSGYLTAHQDISNKLDTTAFSTVSGDFLTAVPSEYVTENTLQSGLSSKLDSTAFSTVSSTFLTAHQSLDGLMSASLLEQSGGLITGYNGTAFAGQGGGVTGDFELSAGSGISIVDYPLEQKTVISVTAQGGNPEVEQAVIDNSATWNDVTAKLDTTAAYTPEIAYHDTAISSIDNSALYDTSAHARINTLAGRISDLSSNKLDTTAFSDVSGTFLTAHQDLSDYQTIAGMTAYQEAGNYLSSNALDNLSGDWNEVSAKLDTTAFSDVSGTFLTAHQDISNKLDTTAFSDVSGSFLTAVPDTYLQNTDLTIVDNKITEISGVPLSAGDELPESVSAATDYITATSGDINATITNVSENSAAWGGEPLPISARDGLDLEISADMLWIGASALNDTLTGKQDITGMTAYQPAGSYLTAVPDTYLQNTDLEISDNKITGISGVPLAAGGGGEVPEGVMAESGLEFNAVNEISGYNGSAIAQYGAEKQWLTHDDTIVHVANSAQYAFGVNVPEVLSASQELIGPKMNEETFAGYWNNQPVYSIMKEVIFNSNVGSSASLPDEVASAAEGRYWIDPSNSFIAYGSQTILLPLSWCLGTGRMGSFNIINGILYYRGFDSAPNTCTAYIAFKYRKA